MIEPFLLTSSLLFGKELLVQSVSKTTTNIYKGLEDINSDESFHFTKILEELDIKAKLDIIHEFINELNDNNIIKSKYNQSKSTDKILSYLCDILKNIETEIESINIEIKTHKTKWFNKFRTATYITMIDNLKKHLTILDSRFDLLLKLLNN